MRAFLDRPAPRPLYGGISRKSLSTGRFRMSLFQKSVTVMERGGSHSLWSCVDCLPAVPRCSSEITCIDSGYADARIDWFGSPTPALRHALPDSRYLRKRSCG